jgi:UDP-N-acetylmuramate: L-alanyl-gamma-D-glutamyl-meso-diaminopimelate ligase
MHIHIIGICGTFMGGLAQLARAAGHRVTGCDANVYPPMSTQLEQAGIELISGFDAAQMDVRPDVWVVGNVATRGMPLVEALLNAKARMVSGPQWLSEELLHRHRVLAVSGTHGKTTTSSILAWILEDAGQSPSFLIGGVPENFGVSARLAGAPFVIEADEYDTAFFDKRSKFLHYRAEVAVLNNLEFDHADIFSDLAAIETQFYHWLRTLPSQGRLVANAQEPALARVLARGVYTPVDMFHQAEGWSIAPIKPGAHASLHSDAFEVRWKGRAVGSVMSALTGEHNRSNVVAAIAAAVAYGVPVEAACSAIARFKGVKRRMQVRGVVNGVRVLDDFAHHPTAIATTIAGLRDQRAREGHRGRLLAVIEPRSNTMKLGVMAARLADSLREADHTFAFAGGIDWDLSAALTALGDRACVHAALPDLIDDIVAKARPGDDVLIMSNGGFGGLHDRLLKALEHPRIGGTA